MIVTDRTRLALTIRRCKREMWKDRKYLMTWTVISGLTIAVFLFAWELMA